jgi:hypothetical protein
MVCLLIAVAPATALVIVAGGTTTSVAYYRSG